MTDEVAADDSDAELGDEIARDVVKLLRDMSAVDKAVETDELKALCAAAGFCLQFVATTAGRLRGFPGFPAEMPGAALKRLVAALTDRDEGKDEPSLSPRRNDGEAARRGAPTLPLNAQLERVNPAVALELIMARDPQSPEDAAKEVLDLLRDSHATALVRQWRTLGAKKGSTPAEAFKALVELAKHEVGERGMTADAYSAVIRRMLIPKN